MAATQNDGSSQNAAATSSSPPSLLDRLALHAREQPDTPVFTVLADAGDRVAASLTYRELDRATASLSAQLLRCLVPPAPAAAAAAAAAPAAAAEATPLQAGDRVLLVYLPSLDFIVAFLACLRAGLVAVPVYPPDPRNLRVNLTLFAAVAASSGARCALSHSAYTSAVSLGKLKDAALRVFGLGGGGGGSGGGGGQGAVSWPELKWVRTDGAGAGSGPAAASLADCKLAPVTGEGGTGLPSSSPSPSPPSPNPSSLAFLQYTSGSTSEPKGVMVSHGNLAHNLRTIVSSLRAGPSTVVASWLPQYHDMGLIGSYLGVVYCGGRGVYTSPLAFIKRPTQWLLTITAYRATHVQAPNFAYALTARKFRELLAAGGVAPRVVVGAAETRPAPRPPRDRESHAHALALSHIDLSSLQHCFNAAEPVTAVALADFLSTFTPYGLAPAALSPGFGLAEHTVYVSDGGAHVVIADRTALERDKRAVVQTSVALADLLDVPRARLVPDKRTAILASCGPVWPYASGRAAAKNVDVTVVIADPETSQLVVEDGVVGEVWVSSPSAAQGYWGREEATREAFHARLAPPTGVEAAAGPAGEAAAEPTPPPLPPAEEEGRGATETSAAEGEGEGEGEGGATAHAGGGGPPVSAPSAPIIPRPLDPSLAAALPLTYLRTGDLAFVWRGELYICGRLKDLLILRGRNFYPQDLEQVAEAAEARLRPGCTAVFATSAEEVVLAAEVRAEHVPSSSAAAVVGGAPLQAIADAVRGAILRDFGIRLSAVVLLKPHGVQKTTSGKVARRWNARAWAALQPGTGGEDGGTAAAAAAAATAGPWAPARNVVLLLARDAAAGQQGEGGEGGAARAGGGDGGEDGGDGEGDGGEGGERGVPRPDGTGVDAASAAPPPAEAIFGHIEGPKLLAFLRRDVAQALGLPEEAPPADEGAAPALTAATLPTSLSLLHLGLDSLALVQMQGKLQAEYGIRIRDELMFAEETTLAWIVAHARELRGGEGVGAGAGVGVGAPEGEAAAAAPDAADPGGPPPGVEVVDPEMLAALRRRAAGGAGAGGRKGPSFLELNCPCFIWCCSP